MCAWVAQAVAFPQDQLACQDACAIRLHILIAYNRILKEDFAVDHPLIQHPAAVNLCIIGSLRCVLERLKVGGDNDMMRVIASELGETPIFVRASRSMIAVACCQCSRMPPRFRRLT